MHELVDVPVLMLVPDHAPALFAEAPHDSEDADLSVTEFKLMLECLDECVDGDQSTCAPDTGTAVDDNRTLGPLFSALCNEIYDIFDSFVGCGRLVVWPEGLLQVCHLRT
jgi:hypothetical protein